MRLLFRWATMMVVAIGILSMARAQEKQDSAESKLLLPKESPPMFGIAVIRDGKLELQYNDAAAVKEDVSTISTRFVDGKTIAEQTDYKQTRHAAKPVTASWDVADYPVWFRVFRNGECLEAEAATAALRRPARVVFMERTLPDEFYLNLLAKDALVICVSPQKEPVNREKNAAGTPAKPAEPAKTEPPKIEAVPKTEPPESGPWTEDLFYRGAGGLNIGRSVDDLQGLSKLGIDTVQEFCFVFLQKRPDIKTGWNKLQLSRDQYRLTWGGHKGKDPRWPAPIRLDAVHYCDNAPQVDATYYLAASDATTSPRLVLVREESNANKWDMEIIEQGSKGLDKTDEPNHQIAGYIRPTDVGERKLWLSLATQKILYAEPTLNPAPREVEEFRELTLSDKQDTAFR
jgi:hypothetical protein